MPFDPQSYITEKQSAFDPASYIAAKQQPDTHSTFDKAEAYFNGVGNVITGGHVPEIQATIQSHMTDPDASIFDESKNYNYDKSLKQFQDQRQQLATEMPDYYYGGEATEGGLLAAQPLMAGGRGLVSLGKTAYQIANSAPGKVVGGLIGGKYLLGKLKGGE